MVSSRLGARNYGSVPRGGRLPSSSSLCVRASPIRGSDGGYAAERRGEAAGVVGGGGIAGDGWGCGGGGAAGSSTPRRRSGKRAKVRCMCSRGVEFEGFYLIFFVLVLVCTVGGGDGRDSRGEGGGSRRDGGGGDRCDR